MVDYSEAIKALKITDDTVLFVDANQIELGSLLYCDSIPKGCLIISVAGKPNVDAMTQAELVDILNRNSARERDER